MLKREDVVPGMIAAVQTFGTLLHWNPHIHSLVTCGAYTPEGNFLELSEFDMDSLLVAWQKAVFSLYLKEGKIEPEVVEKILRHCGLWKASAPRGPPDPVGSVYDLDYDSMDHTPELIVVDMDTFLATF